MQKSSHRGVHSGNTLRASNSRYSRRYHNQACIISRVRSDFLEKLARDGKGKADDKSAAQNIAVDVALSLNKQSRWLLPSALKRQINANDVSSGFTVSLLERHKLKRQANCVSFHCNAGAVKRIQPRNGRYFGFQFPAADGLSRRARRRQQRKVLAKHDLKSGGKVVTVFTEEGRAGEARELGENEVRYEVFYPCPASSSISHNPKYIKQDVAFSPGQGQDGEHAQQGKPRKQHRRKQRKRMSLRDVEDFEFPDYDHAIFSEKVSLVAKGESSVVLSGASEAAVVELQDKADEQKTREFLLSSLIEKSERLQQQLTGSSAMTKLRRLKKSGDSKQCRHHEDDKSHIVYLPTPHSDYGLDTADHSRQQHPPSPSPSPLPEPTRIVLPSYDVRVSSLRESFRQRYLEAACRPRKFVLDVTENVRDVMKKCGIQRVVADNADDALSFLVFTHDGFYDDETHVYKVFLNSRLRRGLLPVPLQSEVTQDMWRGTVLCVVSQAMDFVSNFVCELRDAGKFPTFYTPPKARVTSADRELKVHLASAEAYLPSLQRVFRQGSDASSVVIDDGCDVTIVPEEESAIIPTLADLLEEDLAFCDVCYDDISSLTMGSAAATSLVTCRHRVCDACWGHHVTSRLQQGFVRVMCPGYDCQREVGAGVLLSVAALDTVDKLLHRREEVRIGASQTEKWCPGEGCGRVLHLHLSDLPAERDLAESELQQDVVCACGTHVCFRCLSPAHWPALCTQAEHYRRDIVSAVFPDRKAEVLDDSARDEKERLRLELEARKTMVVEGKHCPKCRNFVYKDGGCPNMTCRCGQVFCWKCAQPGYAHAQCVDSEKEKKLTTTLVVRHIALQAEKEEERRRQEATANRRQKVSLMERAAEHRQRRHASQATATHAICTLAKAVATAASKDANLARHVASICTITGCSSTSPNSTTLTTTTVTPNTQSSPPPSVLNSVTAFLRSAARSKQELHEVAEYTLVLVKNLPDSVLRRRALRVAEDLTAFCTFTQSIFDAWCGGSGVGGPGLGHQEAVRAMVRLAEIQRWVNSALTAHVATVRKLRSANSPQ